MAMFIQTDATGGGAGTLAADQASIDLAIIVNGDTGLGVNAPAGNRQQVTYAPTLAGAPMTRLNTLVNTNFMPDYGAGPQNVVIAILAVAANFILNDGRPITQVGGTALPPQGTGLPGSTLNTTNDCLVIYDTSQSNGAGYCTARNGTGGTLDLPTPNPIILYHELSHAFRIVNNGLLALTVGCNPSSPEENAAITDENDLRTQIANATGDPVELRDPGIHCGATCSGGASGGACCIIASVASGSPISAEVQALRHVRDHYVRGTEAGHAFFDRLLHDYYDFSPQICTEMAREPELQPMVYHGYVLPLISVLRLLRAHAVERANDRELAALLRQIHPDTEAASAQLGHLLAVKAFLSASDSNDEPEHHRRIRGLLSDRALTSQHVEWGLVEPLVFYAEILAMLADGAAPALAARKLAMAFDEWSARAPVDPVWASLPEVAVRRELRFLRNNLLRRPDARRRFADRLKQRYGYVHAVARGLDKEFSAEVPS